MGIEGQQTHATWRAFSSGMHMLKKYAYRSPVDIHSTASANLKLLHKTLRKDRAYKEIFLLAEKKGLISALPTIHWLVKSADLQARFISLGKFSTTTFSAQEDELSMFLVICGKIECQPERVIEQTGTLSMATDSMVRKERPDTLKTTYKVGDSFINKLIDPCTHHIITLEEYSILLEIRLPSFDRRSKTRLDKLAS